MRLNASTAELRRDGLLEEADRQIFVPCRLTGDRAQARAVPELFDMDLRALRRDRAARIGAEAFLFERAFEDCRERIELLHRPFTRALLIGSPKPDWSARLAASTERVDVYDPGPLFAAQSGGRPIIEDAWDPPAGAFDLVLAVGTLDTVNDLPLALRLIGHAMRPDGLFLAAMAGGDSLPQLRAAMRAADAITNAAAPHVHPRIEAAALAGLLTDSGFVAPVVDVDRVTVSYADLRRLIQDLRGMGSTNILKARPRAMGRLAFGAAATAFQSAGIKGRTSEVFEILHLAAWKPK